MLKKISQARRKLGGFWPLLLWLPALWAGKAIFFAAAGMLADAQKFFEFDPNAPESSIDGILYRSTAYCVFFIPTFAYALFVRFASPRETRFEKLAFSLPLAAFFAAEGVIALSVAFATADAARAIGGEQIRGVVLGIDPSLRGTGLAAIEALGGGKMRYVDSETVRNPPSLSMAECIARIFERTLRMIDEYSPDWVSIEQSVYVQNFKTAMILGSARGAAIAAAAHRRREVYEYPPLRIKQAVIGYGRASKEQVGRSVMALLQMGEILPPDESDAGAAAITHIFTHKIRI